MLRQCSLMRKQAQESQGKAKADSGGPLANALSSLGSAMAVGAVSKASTIPAWRNRSMSPIGGDLALLNTPVEKALEGSPVRTIEGITVNGTPLRKYLSDRGISLFSDSTYVKNVGPMFIHDPGAISTLEGIYGKSLKEGINPDKFKGLVTVGFSPKASKKHILGITGHELGHVDRFLRGKSNLGRYARSQKLSKIIGAIGAVRTADNNSSTGEKAGWIAGTALSALPMLHEEVQASRVGSKMVGLKGLSRLHAFKGVPSYAVVAGAPAISLGVRKLIDKAREGKKK